MVKEGHGSGRGMLRRAHTSMAGGGMKTCVDSSQHDGVSCSTEDHRGWGAPSCKRPCCHVKEFGASLHWNRLSVCFWCYWHLIGRGQRCSKHPKMPRIVSRNTKFSGSKCQQCQGWETLSRRRPSPPALFCNKSTQHANQGKVPSYRETGVTSTHAFPSHGLPGMDGREEKDPANPYIASVLSNQSGVGLRNGHFQSLSIKYQPHMCLQK